MAKALNWLGKVFQKPSSSATLDAVSMTYTQILKDKGGGQLDWTKHGLNRDAVRVVTFAGNIGVIAVADGCGLVYWSEIAANIAVNEFMSYCEKNMPKEGPLNPASMKLFLREAIKQVNQNMINWKHPKTKNKFNVLDKGGNTTLMVAIVFPCSEEESSTEIEQQEEQIRQQEQQSKLQKLQQEGLRNSHPTALDKTEGLDTNNTTSSSAPSDIKMLITSSAPSPKSHSFESSSQLDLKPTSKDLEHGITKASTSTHSNWNKSHHEHTESNLRWGVVFTGMGDSELYCYRSSEPEISLKERKNSISSASGSSASLSQGEPLKRSESVSPLPSPRSRQESSPAIPNSSSLQRSSSISQKPLTKSEKVSSKLTRSSKSKSATGSQTLRGYFKSSKPTSEYASSSSTTSKEHSTPIESNAESSTPITEKATDNTPESSGSHPNLDSSNSQTQQTKESKKRDHQSKEDSKSGLEIKSSPNDKADEDLTQLPVERKSVSLLDLPSYDPETSLETTKVDPSHQEAHKSNITTSSKPKVKLDFSDVVQTPEESSTPRLPTGTWERLMSDSGKSPFLPFPGLRDKNIPEPGFAVLSPGDLVLACSDGVIQSFVGEIDWPELEPQLYEMKGGLYYACKALIETTMRHHRDGETDPDDVTLGALKITNFAKKKARIAAVEDLTPSFAPEFASNIYSNRDYLHEYLSEYMKPSKSNHKQNSTLNRKLTMAEQKDKES